MMHSTHTNRTLALTYAGLVALPIFLIDKAIIHALCLWLNMNEHSALEHALLRTGVGILWMLFMVGFAVWGRGVVNARMHGEIQGDVRAAIERAKEEGRNEMLAALHRNLPR